METFTEAPLIEKEDLVNEKFAKTDVLDNDQVRKRLRSIYLSRAEMLGNNFKGKVRIFFKTFDNEIKAVETTIWNANDDHVTLKAGISIPTKSICGIEF
jgi:hypothetical protein